MPAPRPRKSIIDILPFSGKDSEDITKWLMKWDIAATAGAWTDQHQFQILAVSLRDRTARPFGKNLEGAEHDMETLKEALQD